MREATRNPKRGCKKTQVKINHTSLNFMLLFSVEMFLWRRVVHNRIFPVTLFSSVAYLNPPSSHHGGCVCTRVLSTGEDGNYFNYGLTFLGIFKT